MTMKRFCASLWWVSVVGVIPKPLAVSLEDPMSVGKDVFIDRKKYYNTRRI
jgi:hypothetical protein